MNMNSFYGGPNGQSFSISETFGNKAELDADLAKGRTSHVHVGEFVIISYGRAGSDEYSDNLIKDNNVNWNSTLWQKTYREGTTSAKDISNANGFAYRWIAQLVGNTPSLSIGKPNVTDPNLAIDSQILVLDADQKPKAWIDGSSVDTPVLYMALPRSQILQLQSFKWLSANGTPKIEIDKTDINNPGLVIELPRAKSIEVSPDIEALDNNQNPSIDTAGSDENTYRIKFQLPRAKQIEVGYDVIDANLAPSLDTTGSTVNLDKLTFKLPASQLIQKAVIEGTVDNDQDPEVRLDVTEDGTITNPVLKFKLPVTQQFLSDNVTTSPIDADQDPDVSFQGGNEPKLIFSLPKSQVMQDPDKNVVGPLDSPNIKKEGTINEPKFIFDLPRSARFYHGNLLGESRDYEDEINEVFSEYLPGDFYINAVSGNIYEVTKVNAVTGMASFEYVACFQASLPTPDAEGISPYSDTNGTPAEPTVDPELTSTGWKWKFGIPKAPKVTINSVTLVGSSQASQAAAKATYNEDGIVIDFVLPAGARVYSGANEPTSSVGYRPGDLYLNTQTGDTYILQNDDRWQKQTGKLKGPKGDSLSIVLTKEYETSLSDTLENGVNYIKNQLGASYSYKDDELFAITWKQTDDDLNIISNLSYWYYCVDPDNVDSLESWGRVQLTGNIASVIESDYYSGDLTKIYNTSYINNLIGQANSNRDRTAYSKKQTDDMISWNTFDSQGNMYDANNEPF